MGLKDKKIKNIHLFAIVLFLITLSINYLSASGLIFSKNQMEISDMYSNLLTPAGFSFSIWGVIYLGVLINLALPWLSKMSDELGIFYYRKIMPLFILWMTMNILWIVFWSSNLIGLALISIILYTLALIKLVETVYSRKDLTYGKYWLLVFPIGLHTGWLSFASFANLMALLVKNGFDPFSTIGVTFTLLFMSLASLLALFLYNKYDNAFITVPALWALWGIFMKQRPSSEFIQSNQIIMVGALTLLILALIGHLFILKNHRAIEK